MMTTILPPGTLGSVAGTLYQENHELKHQLLNIIPTQLLCIYRYAEVSRWENSNEHFCRKVSLSTNKFR